MRNTLDVSGVASRDDAAFARGRAGHFIQLIEGQHAQISHTQFDVVFRIQHILFAGNFV